VEAVLITTLSAAGGDRDLVVAAVLVYRALTWVLPILVGVVCYLWWRRRSWTTSPQDALRGRGEATVTANLRRPAKG
jgi:putative heme transporter